jgi:uncharacterized membrane protein YtjA (UPF0391 family)
MLGWAITFLIVALIAAALGFGGIAGASAGIAQILFFIFIVLFVVAMIARAVRGRPPFKEATVLYRPALISTHEPIGASRWI